MTRITTCGTNWLAIIISPAWMYRLKKNSLSVSGASGAGGICRNTGNRSTRPASQREMDRQAEELFSQLVEQMAEREGVTEQLKAAHQMEWVGRMNNIRDRVTEIIHAELIFT